MPTGPTKPAPTSVSDGEMLAGLQALNPLLLKGLTAEQARQKLMAMGAELRRQGVQGSIKV